MYNGSETNVNIFYSFLKKSVQQSPIEILNCSKKFKEGKMNKNE